jgi:hypothetical protein
MTPPIKLSTFSHEGFARTSRRTTQTQSGTGSPRPAYSKTSMDLGAARVTRDMSSGRSCLVFLTTKREINTKTVVQDSRETNNWNPSEARPAEDISMVCNGRRDERHGVVCCHAHSTGEIESASATMTIFLVFSMEGLAPQDYDLFCLVLVCLTLFEASPS